MQKKFNSTLFHHRARVRWSQPYVGILQPSPWTQPRLSWKSKFMSRRSTQFFLRSAITKARNAGNKNITYGWKNPLRSDCDNDKASSNGMTRRVAGTMSAGAGREWFNIRKHHHKALNNINSVAPSSRQPYQRDEILIRLKMTSRRRRINRASSPANVNLQNHQITFHLAAEGIFKCQFIKRRSVKKWIA